MIGKIMSEVSHSIIGMLSAQPVDMETHASNFDFNSLLTSSDEQYASVLGENGVELTDKENTLRFSDQFAEHGVHVRTDRKLLDEVEAGSDETPTKVEPETSSEVVSLLSGSFGPLTSPKVSSLEEPRSAERTVTDEPASKKVETDVKQPLAQPFRKPKNLDFGPRERNFVAPAALTDNFAAVESAIARYTGRTDRTDPSQNQILSNSQPDEVSVMTSSSADVSADSDGVVDLDRPAYTLQQNVVLDQAQAPRPNLAVTAQTQAPLEPISINDREERKIARLDAGKLPSSPIEQSGKLSVHEDIAQVLRVDGMKTATPRYEDKQITSPVINRSSERQGPSIPLADLSTELPGKSAESKQSKIDLSVSRAGNPVARPSEIVIPKVEIIRSVRGDVEPKASPSHIQDLPATDLNKPVLTNGSAIQPPVRQETSVLKNAATRGNDEDLSRSLRNGPSRMPAEVFPPEIGKPAPDSRILDSIDLRLASNLDVKRPATIARQEIDITAPEAADEKLTIDDAIKPTAAVDKNIPVTPLAHMQNPVAAPTIHKTVNFDWNSPQFAERFAAEIRDLSVDGDLKKFEINPRNLGRLEVAFLARGSSEFIRIEAENQAARDVIVQHSQAIQDMLKAQGRSDLSIRVDVKDTGFSSSSDSNGLNFSQQDGTNAREDRSGGRPKSGAIPSSDARAEPEIESDQGRYA